MARLRPPGAAASSRTWKSSGAWHALDHRGGLQGGVAILCPGPARVEARRELVPGCAVEATITGLPGAPAVTYVSLYLPPGRQAEVITELDGIHPPAAPFVIGGDMNLDLDDPRDLEEERNGQALRALLQRWVGGPALSAAGSLPTG